MKNRIIDTDVLIIGGGTAGCFAGITLGKKKDLDVLIVEKANIVRSGCLAAGVNAINAYITKGRVPQDYVDYCKKDADGIVREDLLLSMSERLNHVTKVMEDLGLVILKDENGDYVARGNRNIKINGENIKPILADAVKKQDNVAVINHLNITDFIVENNEIKGAYGFDVNDAVFYEINAKAVLVATGGAAGLYRPNNPGFSRHKMWYPPFNTGAGYAMGINAGAEMTTFEMRFIALRCKDTIAPTGTIAQGVPAKQLNSNGEVYENKYGLTTSQRLYGTVTENREGRGPCYLGTKIHKGESMRVFPISNWTEKDIWQYIQRDKIDIVPLYFAAERPVVYRDGNIIMVDDDRMRLLPGEKPQMKKVRFRTLGCYPLTGGVESDAETLDEIIEETLSAVESERTSRVIDHEEAGSMERRKKEGYF